MPTKKAIEKKPVVKKASAKKVVAKKAPVKKVADKDAKKAPPKKRRSKKVELLRGFRDVLPEDQKYWDYIRDTARNLSNYYSFGRIELPILEMEDLFKRSLGKVNDVIEKEMYTFVDPGENNVALRPEATASVARAYVGHGMLNRPQPVKLYYEGPMFRHDRPQAGRYRQFHQFGFESIGEADPIVDAQLIVIAHRFFKDLGLDVIVELNSIGTLENRKEYLVELTSYFRQFRKDLSDDDKRRLQKNPLRLLDSKEDYMPQLLENAPQLIDWLDEKSKDRFMKVLEYLEEVEVPYRLNPHLVRGLDYYAHTVFEVKMASNDESAAQDTLLAGGRYDGLVEQIGGREEGTPACGFACGIERVVLALKKAEIDVQPSFQPKVFFAQLGEAARRKGLRMFEEFREAGVPVVEAFGKGALKTQLEIANKIGVLYTVIVGQKEVLDGTVIIRDMEAGSQEIVDAEKLVSLIQKRLG